MSISEIHIHQIIERYISPRHYIVRRHLEQDLRHLVAVATSKPRTLWSRIVAFIWRDGWAG